METHAHTHTRTPQMRIACDGSSARPPPPCCGRFHGDCSPFTLDGKYLTQTGTHAPTHTPAQEVILPMNSMPRWSAGTHEKEKGKQARGGGWGGGGEGMREREREDVSISI